MSAKHTKGPWIVQPGTLTIYTLSDGTIGTTNAIAVPCRRSRDGGSSVSFDEAEANARLIAAAPELLAALREIHEIMEEAMHPDSAETEIDLCDLIGTASRAIAKATGEA